MAKVAVIHEARAQAEVSKRAAAVASDHARVESLDEALRAQAPPASATPMASAWFSVAEQSRRAIRLNRDDAALALHASEQELARRRQAHQQRRADRTAADRVLERLDAGWRQQQERLAQRELDEFAAQRAARP